MKSRLPPDTRRPGPLRIAIGREDQNNVKALLLAFSVGDRPAIDVVLDDVLDDSRAMRALVLGLAERACK